MRMTNEKPSENMSDSSVDRFLELGRITLKNSLKEKPSFPQRNETETIRLKNEKKQKCSLKEIPGHFLEILASLQELHEKINISLKFVC